MPPIWNLTKDDLRDLVEHHAKTLAITILDELERREREKSEHDRRRFSVVEVLLGRDGA